MNAGVLQQRSAFDPEHGQKGGVTDLEEEIQRYKRRGFWISFARITWVGSWDADQPSHLQYISVYVCIYLDYLYIVTIYHIHIHI